jgi:hypothetical protein
MSQCSRILRALERGPVRPTDFLLPDVIDGEKPIIRVAARIQDLRDQGHEITTSTAANGVAVYQLEQDVTAVESRDLVAHPDADVLLESLPPNGAAQADDIPLPPGSQGQVWAAPALFETSGSQPHWRAEQ